MPKTSLNSFSDLGPDELGDPTQGYDSLVESVASGRDREAFTALFNAFAPKLRSYMMRSGAAPELAEDLAIEAMARLWRQADTFDATRATAAGWIFKIARNCRIDGLRRERHSREFIGLDGVTTPTRPDEHSLAGERERRIGSAMEGLPMAQAQVLEMSFLQDVSNPQIAKALNLPLGTVRSCLRLALRRLRAIWGDET